MTRKTVSTDIIECDICAYEAPVGLFSGGVIEINGHDWDFCDGCYEASLCFLQFMTVVVGVDIQFKAKGQAL